MRIDRLELRNFRMFSHATFAFQRPVHGSADGGSFHVLIGENGSGKTTILDAAAVALAAITPLAKPPQGGTGEAKPNQCEGTECGTS